MFDIWHIGIPVKDLEVSINFYLQIGFELLGRYDKNLAFVRPATKFFTLELMELKDELGNGFEKKPHHLAFESENLQHFHRHLVENKIKNISEISDSISGMKLFSLKDPDGITIQFYQGSTQFEKDIQYRI